MALLRKHIRDDAGRRVPLYRTGAWPFLLSHECPLPAVEGGAIASVGSRAFGLLSTWLVFFPLMWVVGNVLVFPSAQSVVIGVCAAAGVALLVPFSIGCITGYGLARPDWLRTELLLHRRCPSCGFGLEGGDGARTCAECGSVWAPPARIAARHRP